MKSTKRLRHKGSFTLIELVLTIVVVGIAAVPLSLLVFQHVESTFQSEDYSMAVNLARFEMERVKNLAYDDIVSATFAPYPGYNNYDVVRTVTYAFGGPASAESLKEVRVEVRRAGSATALLTFVTYVARNVNYGI